MKFENIKVGDTVFTPKYVRYGYNRRERFFIPQKVTKVTKTQFTVEDGDRFKKDSGIKIGGQFYTQATYEGEDVSQPFSSEKEVVTDQTEAMNAFKMKLKAEKKINEIAKNIRCELNSNLTLLETLELVGKLEKIADRLKRD